MIHLLSLLDFDPGFFDFFVRCVLDAGDVVSRFFWSPKSARRALICSASVSRFCFAQKAITAARFYVRVAAGDNARCHVSRR
jgi:hypothetical protein